KKVLKIATLKGPTGMGMIQLMENDAALTSALDYEFEIVGAPDQIIGQIIQGKVDIAAVPSNLAAILNAKTKGSIQLLGVNTLGVLFIVENGRSIQNIKDLKGKSILSSGKGASPEYIINYILDKNNLANDIKIEYAVEHSEVAAKLKSGVTQFALLPQPFVTSVILGNKEARVAIDLTDEWRKITDGSVLPMGVIIVDKVFAKENPDVIKTFMDEYKASVEFVNGQPEEAGVLIEKFGILPKAALAIKAIPNCNITLMSAKEAKASILKFYQILYDFNPKSIGGQIPDDEFFYEN
ncbi:MAG: ABC transporter substrate-binding protein, partial [Spirochaetes bacterium]|nr:ABC transporter substrate-binding protein [Spirochaetota bacterium]